MSYYPEKPSEVDRLKDRVEELEEEKQRLRKRLDWIAYDRHPDMTPQEAAKDALNHSD